ncbi:MAG: SRPBCC family protein [Nocardioidaceae bacterium]
MRIETTVDVDAPRDVLWMVLLDVESWPALTASMTTVTRSDEGPLAVGSSVWIKQPRLPRTEWTVTELTACDRFVWQASGPGVRTTAAHLIEQVDADSCRLRLVLDQEGALGGLLGRLIGGMARRYVALEAEGLKGRAESLA